MKEKKVVGFVAGEIGRRKKNLGRIITIEIDPAFQHRHIGTKLLQKIEKNMREIYKISKIELQVHYLNQKAISIMLIMILHLCLVDHQELIWH